MLTKIKFCNIKILTLANMVTLTQVKFVLFVITNCYIKRVFKDYN